MSKVLTNFLPTFEYTKAVIIEMKFGLSNKSTTSLLSVITESGIASEVICYSLLGPASTKIGMSYIFILCNVFDFMLITLI